MRTRGKGNDVVVVTAAAQLRPRTEVDLPERTTADFAAHAVLAAGDANVHGGAASRQKKLGE